MKCESFIITFFLRGSNEEKWSSWQLWEINEKHSADVWTVITTQSAPLHSVSSLVCLCVRWAKIDY